MARDMIARQRAAGWQDACESGEQADHNQTSVDDLGWDDILNQFNPRVTPQLTTLSTIIDKIINHR
jgi:hypothetical protein